MAKPTKYTLSFINDYLLTSDDKKMILDRFKQKESKKIVKCADSFLMVNDYERNIKVYNTEYPEILNEIRQLPVGTLEWWNQISSKAQNHLNQLFYMYYQADYQSVFTYYFENEKSGEYQYYDTKLQCIIDFSRQYELDIIDDEDCFDIDKLERILKHNRLVDERLVKLNVISYCLAEKDYQYIDLDSNGNVILTDLAIEKFIYRLEPIPLTTKEKMKKSVDRSYQVFKKYCLCNCEKFEYFMTLTFAHKEEKEKHIELNNKRREIDNEVLFEYVEDSTNYDICVKSMTKFLDNLKHTLKRKGYELYYLGVPEYQNNGSIHYHFLISDIPDELFYKNPDWIDRDYNTNKIRNSRGIKLWKYGISDIQYVKSKSRISTYLSKYLLKSLTELNESEYLDRLNKKRYYCSNNLIKPEIEYSYFDESQIEFYDVSHSFVKNGYDGSLIKNSIYTLKENLL